MRESKQMKQTANIDVAVVSPASATHYELEAEVHFANRIELANAIAEQIWREQQLVSNRMQWNFTFHIRHSLLAYMCLRAPTSMDGKSSSCRSCWRWSGWPSLASACSA